MKKTYVSSVQMCFIPNFKIQSRIQPLLTIPPRGTYYRISLARKGGGRFVPLHCYMPSCVEPAGKGAVMG
jgi:hypothetical protein